MSSQPKFLPLLCLKDSVPFPGLFLSLFVHTIHSRNAIDMMNTIDGGHHILIAAQKNTDIATGDITPSDIYRVGVVAQVLQIIHMNDDSMKILVKAVERVKLRNIRYNADSSCFISGYTVLPDHPINDKQSYESFQVALSNGIKVFEEYQEVNKKIHKDLVIRMPDDKNASHLINLMISHSTLTMRKKQLLLELQDVCLRIHEFEYFMHTDIIDIQTEDDITKQLKRRIDQNQKEYYINEKIKVLQQELNRGNGDKDEFDEIEKKINSKKLSQEARDKAKAEFKRLKSMGQQSAESSVIRNYLETLLDMPWGKFDKSSVNIKKASEILNRDHYGLEKIKERILEYLAVLERSDKISGPILCLVGPPGVGKTSLVKSIAEAVGRKYSKFSLGGVRDESEIRGHRRTYLGSMPGKIISLIKKAKTSNPVMLLDEIDKMSADFKGDPASALLEVLDSEQNKEFVDHYLDVGYNISDVMFIATANSLNLPRPLLDRMEIIRISGYVEDEKLQITRKYLIPKKMNEYKLTESEITITDEAILELIRYYTRESGVRSLEREVGALNRKVLKEILENHDTKSITITEKEVEKYLGPRKYNFGISEKSDQIGVTTGLAYTEVGGELLPIEAVAIPGKGEIRSTGKLGDVMKESTQAAFSYFQSQIKNFGIKYEDYKNSDIHIHMPEAAVPKDGPSAGIALLTTIVSLMTSIPVKKTVAMTGEITLRGTVIPIGGLKEKLLAASRGGIETVLIPKDNQKDLDDIPDSVKSKLIIIPVSTATEVLDLALTRSPWKHDHNTQTT